MGLYLFSYDLVDFATHPIADLSRTIARGFWSNAIFPMADYIRVFFQTPPPLLAIVYTFLSWLALNKATGRSRLCPQGGGAGASFPIQLNHNRPRARPLRPGTRAAEPQESEPWHLAILAAW